MGLLSNGHCLLTTASCPWDPEIFLSQTYAVELDAAWNVTHMDTMPLAEPSFQNPASAANWPLFSLILPSGNLLINGHYWKCFCEERGSVLQRVTQEGLLLAQWTSDSPYLQELPAVARAMDPAADGTLFYAQMNNWQYAGWLGSTPSQVQLFHLDTAFNVLGSYLFDGFLDSTYYFPSVVRATPDGGVLVGGSMRNLNIPNSPPVAWLAKFGAEGLVAVPERTGPLLGLYPNPGVSGFQLMLRERLEGATLEVVDAKGARALQTPISGLNVHIDAGGWPSGLYAVTVRDASGAILVTERWVKE